MGNFSSENRELGKDQKDQSLVIKDLLFKCLSYWRWFLLSILVCLIFGTLFYLKSSNVYTITSSVLLKEDKGATGGPLGQLEGLGLLNTTSNVDNEIAVFSSPNLIRQVILSKELYINYYSKGLFNETEVYDNCPFVVKLNGISPLALKDNIKLEIKKKNGKIEVRGHYTYKNEEEDIYDSFSVLPASIKLPDNLGQIDLAYREEKDSNEESYDLSKEYLITIENAQLTAYKYTKLIRVTPVSKNSSVLSLMIEVNNAKKGVDILNSLVHLYNINSVSDNNEMAINTSKFVRERMDTIESELRYIENQIVNYKKNQGITDVSIETSLYAQQSGSLEQKRTDVETQLKMIQLVEDYVKKSDNTQLIPNIGITDPGLAEIISRYNNLILDYGNLEKTTNDDNPTRIRVLANINSTKESIIDAVNNVKKSINISKIELEKQVNALSTKIESIPSQERGLLEIMRQQQTKQSLLLYLMQVEAETNITMASTADKAKSITDPIIPPKPDSPKKSVIFVISIMIGVMIPIVVLYIKDLLRVNIDSREELENMSKVPVIGEILKNKEDNDVMVVKPHSVSPIVELFKALRNNVQFMLNSPDKKVILVTSTIPGEGKTFIAINLALSFSLSSKKVLLIGMDIRNPQLSNEMKIKKGEGLTSYLSSNISDWRTLVSSVNEYANLKVLQAGIIPPNPNELLMLPKVKQLIEEAKQEYDLIIIDSAPVGVVSDTFLIGNQADLTVYVTRENTTPKNAIQFINQLNKDSKLNNMYLVINGVDLSRNKKGRGQYGYGKTYGYGVKNS